AGYRDAGSVSAAYNEARLTPLTLPWQTTLFSQVEVTPGATTYRYHDYWATQVTAFDLHRPHQQLRVVSSSLVECAPRPVPVEKLSWTALSADAVADAHAELLTSNKLTELPPALVGSVRDEVRSADPYDTAVGIAEW